MFVGITKWTNEEIESIKENGGFIPDHLASKAKQIKAEKHEQSLKFKQASERFQEQAILAIADVLVVVVNELTMKDQKYIENLYSEIQRDRTRRRKLMVIHNYKEIQDPNILRHHTMVTNQKN